MDLVRSSYPLTVERDQIPKLEGWFLDPSTSTPKLGEPCFCLSWSRQYMVATTLKNNRRTDETEIRCAGLNLVETLCHALGFSVSSWFVLRCHQHPDCTLSHQAPRHLQP